jgi:hypothetical protein
MAWATDLRQALALASQMGRRGDDRLAHINGFEAAVLKALGGAGSINPATGLEEYGPVQGGWGGGQAGGVDGTGKGKDKSNSKDKPQNGAINPGNPNLGLSGPDYSGPTGAGTGVDPAHPDGKGPRSSKDGGAGGGGWDKGFGPAPTSNPDGTVKTKNGPVDLDKFMKDWTDYHGLGYGEQEEDSLWDKFWNGVVGYFGIDEKNPLTDDNYNTPENPAGAGANWGLDPIGLGLALSGLLGGPTTYGAYTGAQWLGYDPPTIDFGPDMMNGPIGFDWGSWGDLGQPSNGGTTNAVGSQLSGANPRGGGYRRDGGGSGGAGEKTNNSGGVSGGGIAGGGRPTPQPPSAGGSQPKPVNPPTQSQTPPSVVSYYLPIKDRDTGETSYIFEGNKLTNPNFGLAQGWGANIVFL